MLLLCGIKQTCFDRVRSKIDYHMSGGKPALSLELDDGSKSRGNTQISCGVVGTMIDGERL